MDPILVRTTDTTKFLLPMVIKDGYTYKDIQNNLIGTYISHSNLPEYTECIIVVFNEDVKPKCLLDDYLAYVVSYNEEHDAYDYMYIYQIEDNSLDDYFEFIKGQYSDFSTKLKLKILDFWQAKEDTFLYSILYKNQENIKKLIQKHKVENTTWNTLYSIWYYKLTNNKELYGLPNLKEEMYGYNSEL